MHLPTGFLKSERSFVVRCFSTLTVAATGSVVALGLIAGPAHAASTPPPSLLNETLTSTAVTATCPPVGFSGQEPFSAMGLASQPYGGTFVESGTTTYLRNDVATLATATARITSPTGDVTVQNTEPMGVNLGCGPVDPNIPGTFTAVITTPDGSTYSDTGTTMSSLDVNQVLTLRVTSASAPVLTSGPMPVLPEAPLAAALPITGLVIVGVVVSRRRRTLPNAQ
ncbi:MAG: hypothetical protein M3063_05710 [Actinomycetota bacterium]|nr:hypothetical protein [Actinomycetota bacterium]